VRPGEVSLAHHGVLFLDELPEYSRNALEVLRQPLEEGVVRLSRARGAVSLPARFLLVAAMNPCPCGYWGDPSDRCLCDPAQVLRYRARVSGPLLDRIDLHVHVAAVPFPTLAAESRQEASDVVRERVVRARATQSERFRAYAGTFANAHLGPTEIRRLCAPSPEAARLIEGAVDRLGLSARAYHRLLKVARTVADLEGAATISAAHAAEAVQYRALERPGGA
jgi:magnesium chelatase family protein